MSLHLHTKYPPPLHTHTHLQCTLLSPPQRSCGSLQGDFQSGVCLFIMCMKLTSNWGSSATKDKVLHKPGKPAPYFLHYIWSRGAMSSPPSLSGEVPSNQEEGISLEWRDSGWLLSLFVRKSLGTNTIIHSSV